MTKSRLRIGILVASALALVAGAPAVDPPHAWASHAGFASVLTASNGGTSIAVSSASPVSVGESASEAQWSPDGSRAIYIGPGSALDSIRYTGGAIEKVTVVPADGSATRHHPTWSADGRTIYWSEQAAAGQPWQLMSASSSPSPYSSAVDQ